MGPVPLLSALAPALQTVWEVVMHHLQAEINQRQCTRNGCQRVQVELEQERSRSAAISGNREHLYAELLRLLKENEMLKEKVFSMARSTQESIVEGGMTRSRL
jgi:hypothetical protein